jgi:hypothetical protein
MSGSHRFIANIAPCACWRENNGISGGVESVMVAASMKMASCGSVWRKYLAKWRNESQRHQRNNK